MGNTHVNVDFYEVVRTTAKYVFLVASLSHREKIHYMQYTAMPVWGSGYGAPLKRKLIQLGSSEPLHLSVQGYGKEALNLDRILSSCAGQSLRH